MNELTTVLEAVAKAWNGQGICYAVAHGLEEYPQGCGRDLDVLIQSDQVERALRVAREVLTTCGMRVVQPPPSWEPRLIAATAGRSPPKMLEIHALPGIRWASVVLADNPRPTMSIGPFEIDPWVAVAKRVILLILSGNTSKLSEKASELVVTDAEMASASARLPDLFGHNLAQTVLHGIASGSVADLERIGPALRRAAVARSAVRHPSRSTALLLGSVVRKLKRPLTSCAPVVALVGPDGVGKTTVLNRIALDGRLVFTDVVVRHWRPWLLPPLDRLLHPAAGKVSSAGGPPRRRAGPLRLVRIAYYYADFFLGGIFKDRVDSSHQRLVLYDRWFTDMIVDPLRYGLRSARGLPSLLRFMPGPDLVILLTDLPERIHRRKAELPLDEIERQLRAWRPWIDNGHVRPVTVTGLEPDEISRRVIVMISEVFLEKHGVADPTGPGAPVADRRAPGAQHAIPASSPCRQTVSR
jgi:hypothetical protein